MATRPMSQSRWLFELKVRQKMFVFWSVVWAFVILSFLNGIIEWNVPKELQIPDILLKTVGGLPSLYAYRLALETDAESLNKFLQAFVDDQLENLPAIEFKASRSSVPKCSLTKSSRSSCLSLTAQNCDRLDERCPHYWLKKAGRRVVKCFDLVNRPLNCNSNGYSVQKIYHNSTQLMIFMSATSTQSKVQQIKVETIQDCQHYFMKQDQTLLFIPIQDNFSKKKIPLRQNTQTVIHYSVNQQNGNLASLADNFLNSTKFCTCTNCYEISDQESISNKTIAGFTAKLLTETNKTTVNLTAILQDEKDDTAQLDFKLKAEIVDRTTPMFWRRPGRFDCPSEVTCPLELLYIFKVQSGLVVYDYIIELFFLITIILYQKKRNREYL